MKRVNYSGKLLCIKNYIVEPSSSFFSCADLRELPNQVVPNFLLPTNWKHLINIEQWSIGQQIKSLGSKDMNTYVCQNPKLHLRQIRIVTDDPQAGDDKVENL